MTFLDRLERIFGGFAIPGLIRYIVMANAGVFLLMLMRSPIVPLLDLDPALVLKGQIWRLVTWTFIPTTTSFIWIFFYLAFTWWAGDTLEATWGSFRLNLYYFLGMLGCTISAFFLGVSYGNLMLSFTLLLALATLAPDLEILFFFFPLKLKWVALLSIVYPWGFLFVGGGLAAQLMIIICLSNYLLFFGPELYRQSRQNRAAYTRRAKFQAEAKVEESFTMHKCAVCGATEVSAPDLDFRVAADGHEYCSAHLPK